MGTSNQLPEYLKTIYVLVVDDELAKPERRRHIQGLIRGIAALDPRLDGWTIEVRTDTNPFLALMHVQVRPADIILLDCRFEVEKPGSELDVIWHELRPFLKCMFAIGEVHENYAGLELIKYLHRAGTYEISTPNVRIRESLDLYTVLFTGNIDKHGELTNACKDKQIHLRKLTKHNSKDLFTEQAEALSDYDKKKHKPIPVPYLYKGDEEVIDKLRVLLVDCKDRIIGWWMARKEPDRIKGKEYRLFHRFISHKFAHYDWLPEYMKCLPASQCEERQERFRIPIKTQSIVFCSRGRDFTAPSADEKGILFAFPQNAEVESTSKDLPGPRFPSKEAAEALEKLPKKYRGRTTIEKAMVKFIEYFHGFITAQEYDWTKQAVIHCGYDPPRKSGPEELIGDKYLTRTDVYKIAAASVTNKPDTSQEQFTFSGIQVRSPIWLAATPLTGSSMAGPPLEVILHYVDKIKAFVAAGYVAVLKTVYPMHESNREWPVESMHRTSQSRCYKVGSEKDHLNFNFYNTGKTALETFPPKMFMECLKKFALDEELALGEGNPTSIIPSLGAHRCDSETWRILFDEVFGLPEVSLGPSFRLVEINARHAIRDLVNKAKLGGDEYFHPLSSDFALSAAKLSSFYHGFEEWVRIVARLADDRGLKVIFKFPFRVDLFVLLSICNTVQKENKAIGGVTLLNTFKSPLINKREERAKTDQELKWREKAGDPNYRISIDKQEWFDIIKHPQVSGIYIKPLRNYILDALHDPKFVEDVGEGFNLDISASGGVLSHEDIYECFALGARSVQIGTRLLHNFNMSIDKSLLGKSKTAGEGHHIYKRNRELDKLLGGKKRYAPLIRRIVDFRVEKCGRCGNCYKSFYCDAFLNRRLYGPSGQSPWVPYNGQYYDLTFPILDENACVGCGVCVQLCPNEALELRLADPTSTDGGVFNDRQAGFAEYYSVNEMGQLTGKRTVSTRRLVLASTSERRKSLMDSLGFRFTDFDPKVPEDDVTQDPRQRVLNNAKMKVEAVVAQIQRDNPSLAEAVVIGCDTVMVFNDGKKEEILEKPKPATDKVATEMLMKLNGKAHTAMTGLYILDLLKASRGEEGASRADVAETKVVFKENELADIVRYVSTGEPLDKAGAYGIQGQGETLIDRIEGNYSNVMGLPKELLVRLLREMGIIPR